MGSITLLTTDDHSRSSAGMVYVYPVVSRRAKGVSIGINLNPNNACNWRCVYCQVPDLKRGSAPKIDLQLLEAELDSFLKYAVGGDFLRDKVADGLRQLVDVAFSGNGEPTSAIEFHDAVCLVKAALVRHELVGKVLIRLITNGSLLDKKRVQRGISELAAGNGEVWFKLDSATEEGVSRINGSRGSGAAVSRRLAQCIDLAPTWIQTCLFQIDGDGPTEVELMAYVSAVEPFASRLAGVHLYSLARPSLQKMAPRLSRLEASAMEVIALRLRQLGLRVEVSP